MKYQYPDVKFPKPDFDAVFDRLVDPWFDISEWSVRARRLFWIFLPISGALWIIAIIASMLIGSVGTTVYAILWFWITGIIAAFRKENENANQS